MSGPGNVSMSKTARVALSLLWTKEGVPGGELRRLVGSGKCCGEKGTKVSVTLGEAAEAQNLH